MRTFHTCCGCLWALLVGALALAGVPAGAATLYVSPVGRDTWSGRVPVPAKGGKDGPLASLQGARDAVRKLKAGGILKEPVRVQVAGGTYRLAEPLFFTPDDSGTPKCPVVYEAAPGPRPVFEGAREIRGFRQAEGGVWAAKVPEVAAGRWYFEQLWVNGRRAVRARTPNVVRLGETPVPRYLYVHKKVGFGIDPLTGRRADLTHRAFYARPEDIAALASPSADVGALASLPPEQLKDVTLIAYHAWESTRLRLAVADPKTGLVVTTGPSVSPFQWLGPNQRYHIENYREALDQPGEWFLGRDGVLLYKPLPGERIATARVVAPVVEEFVRFTGDPGAGLPVEHIALRGLSFRYSGYTLPPQGHGDGQAACGVPAVIQADGARHITLEGCEIAHTGTYGVWFRRGCSDCAVRRCEVYDLGAGGLRIGEVAKRIVEAERTGRILFDNNLIRSGGRLFSGAVGVWIGQSGDNQVTHNDISDLFYTGVSVGWSWGYADTLCKRNQIEYNHIHHLGWGVMSDMGGVYTLGINDGTSVSHNVIHDVYSYNKYGYGGIGLYNDEGTTHITMENNLVYRIRDMTYHQHYGRENAIRNNILVCGDNYQVSVHRVEPHLSCTFENNIVYWKQGKLFWQSGLGERKLRFNRNLYWSAAGEPFDFLGLSLEEWRKAGQDVDSVVADPLFVDPDRLDFRLKPSSPALKLGFKPFDPAKAGLYGDPAWAARARRLTYPAVVDAPEPPPAPPLVVNEGFEDCLPGTRPVDGAANVEGKGDSIAITDEAAAGGKQSLKLTDADGLKHPFDPHLVYNPSYTTGVAHCSFDLRLEPGAEVWHEYRDWSVNPYTIGPRLNIVEGKLSVGDRVLAEIPAGEWVRVAISVRLGDAAPGTWELALTLPGGKEQRFTDLQVASPGWRKLTWIGFVSNATHQTAFYLDNVRIENAP